MRSRNGVRYYTKAELINEVYFPESDVCCYNCSFFRRGKKHMSCSITHQEVTDIYFEGIGSDCPLIFKKEKEEKDVGT